MKKIVFLFFALALCAQIAFAQNADTIGRYPHHFQLGESPQKSIEVFRNISTFVEKFQRFQTLICGVDTVEVGSIFATEWRYSFGKLQVEFKYGYRVNPAHNYWATASGTVTYGEDDLPIVRLRWELANGHFGEYIMRDGAYGDLASWWGRVHTWTADEVPIIIMLK
jgi:hypothetical protein